MSYTVKKHDLGYYFISPVPSEQELKEYYEKKYYQDLTSSTYQASYSKEELAVLKNDIIKYIETFTGLAKAKISRSCIAFAHKQKK